MQFTSMVVYGFFFILLLQIISILLKERNEETSILVSVDKLEKPFFYDIQYSSLHNILVLNFNIVCLIISVPLVGCIWVSVLFDTWNSNSSNQQCPHWIGSCE